MLRISHCICSYAYPYSYSYFFILIFYCSLKYGNFFAKRLNEIYFIRTLYTCIKPALKYSSIGCMQSSTEVVISIDSFSFSSATCLSAYCCNCLGSLMLELNTFPIKADGQNFLDLNALY